MNHLNKFARKILITCALLAASAAYAAPPPQELWYHPKAVKLECPTFGPYIRLKTGEIMTLTERDVMFSTDNGKTWRTQNLFPKDNLYFEFCNERLLFQTKAGTLLLVFINKKQLHWKWNKVTQDIDDATRVPTYVMRSTDGGKTWSKPKFLHKEWTGANRKILQTRDGTIAFTSMMMLRTPGRHATITYSSKDDGLTWRRSNIIDLGGIGNHDGAMEATMEELKDGRLWMLLRTNWDCFWAAFSDDSGVSWRTLERTKINASAAPAHLHRLTDGRLVMIWNQLYPEGKTSFERWGGDGQWSEIPSSCHRTELSMSISSDEGETWSDPVVIGRVAKGYIGEVKTILYGGFAATGQVARGAFDQKIKWQDISYAHTLEIKPGVLWITTMRGGYAAQLRVDDLQAK